MKVYVIVDWGDHGDDSQLVGVTTCKEEAENYCAANYIGAEIIETEVDQIKSSRNWDHTPRWNVWVNISDLKIYIEPEIDCLVSRIDEKTRQGLNIGKWAKPGCGVIITRAITKEEAIKNVEEFMLNHSKNPNYKYD